MKKEGRTIIILPGEQKVIVTFKCLNCGSSYECEKEMAIPLIEGLVNSDCVGVCPTCEAKGIKLMELLKQYTDKHKEDNGYVVAAFSEK